MPINYCKGSVWGGHSGEVQLLLVQLSLEGFPHTHCSRACTIEFHSWKESRIANKRRPLCFLFFAYCTMWSLYRAQILEIWLSLYKTDIDSWKPVMKKNCCAESLVFCCRISGKDKSENQTSVMRDLLWFTERCVWAKLMIEQTF